MGIETVRGALRACLESLGHEVGSDSHGLRTGLYLVGDNDLARAMFEFKPTAEDAFHELYQGNWTSTMPPRFAVLPESEAAAASLEMLEQIHVVPLFFAEHTGYVEFRALAETLAAHLPAVSARDEAGSEEEDML